MTSKPARAGMPRCCLPILVAGLFLPMLACSQPPSSGHALSPTECAAPSGTGYHGALAKGWENYQPYIRACPLAGPGTASAKVWLLTVFAQPWLDSHPNQPDWPDFPRPMLVSADGHCLARLPELFPFDEPRTLSLRYGPSVDGVPGEIHVHVSNPAMGGDYDLPVLKWAPQHATYVAQNDTDEYKKDDMTCRI